jgi:AmmeMemoRadiSam system protein B
MQKIKYLIICFSLIAIYSCNHKKNKNIDKESSVLKVRQQKDTIGFAQYAWQMDSVMARISSDDKVSTSKTYKTVICPHDDYAYAAGLYNKTLAGIKAKTIILIGVAHYARDFHLKNKIIFGSYEQWKSPYDGIKLSPFRNELIQKLKKESYVVHDSIIQKEHSLEAITPFLQKNNKDVEILPILIPTMTFENMEIFSEELSEALSKIMANNGLSFGNDIAIVISNDAIHYGDEGWNGFNFAPFGSDDKGNEKAKQKDLTIIKNCLEDELYTSKIKLFNQYTVNQEDYHRYSWVWCGRYSIPFGLLFANKLNGKLNNSNLNGSLIDWRSSLHNQHIEVIDIGMGHTAPANSKHWVAFTGISYQ